VWCIPQSVVYHLGGGTLEYESPRKVFLNFRNSLFSLLKNDGGIAQTYAAIGHMYEKRKMYDSAFYYQQTALIYANKIGSIAAQAKIYENIGSIYEDRSQFDSAKFYFEKSLLLYQQNQDVLSSIEVINNLGDVYQKSGDYQRGLYYAKQAMLLAQQNKAMYQLQSAYRDMGQNFAMMQQHDSAYQYLEKSRALVQQIYAAENGQQIALQQTMYDTEKKNAEITRLQADKKVTSTIIVAAVLLLIVLSLLGIVAFSRQKFKIKNEQSINETNQKIFDTEKGLMESELQRQQLQEENLQQQLEIKSSQLSSHILHLIQKNEVMEEIKTGLTEIIHDDKRDQKKQLRQLLQKINFSFSQDSYWEQFRLIFDQVHTSFFTNLTQQFPSLTASELKLLSLIKMNLSTGDIATLLGITQDSLRVNRYRLKKKLGLEQGASLTAFIQAM
jgi:tetratricopeptide (TPR) repeat protein